MDKSNLVSSTAILISITLASFCFFTGSSSLRCLDDQLNLLLKFKSQLVFNSALSRKWNQTSDCCTWDGIGCDTEGRVISLQLRNLGLLAEDYFNLTQFPNLLYGPIPSFDMLKKLSKVKLYMNGFTGSLSSLDFASLSNLVYLDLSFNRLNGSIPQSLFRIPSLETLILTFNDFSGRIHEFPAPHSSNMSWLDLNYNKLEGPIPNSFFKLQKLTTVGLSSNRNLTIDASIIINNSSFSTLSQLRSLRLASCNLHSFPNLRNQSRLTELDLSDNEIMGEIPSWVFQIPSLQVLILSGNHFSGRIHEFVAPHSSNLTRLNLRSNRLEGPIPNSFFKLEKLTSLDLSYNSFNGTLKLGKSLSVLSDLDLSYNNLSVDASIINNSSFSKLLHLTYLSLASCNLYSFPNLRNQSLLIMLDLSNNWITGEIPSWVWEIGDGRLFHLNLSFNHLVGLQRPYNIPHIIFGLYLQSNQLQGQLPFIASLPYRLDYSNNRFEGSLPLDIGNLSGRMNFLSFANNRISGIIPPSSCNSTALNFLDLSGNKLSGNIPPCLFRDVQYLGVLDLGGNNISGSIPNTFSPKCYLQTLDLSNNNVEGKIPPSLFNCKSLQVMNVESNKIEGSFPCMMLPSLRILMLRSNNFYGEVRCHGSWPSLQILDIASNNFSGNLHTMNFSSLKGMMQPQLGDQDPRGPMKITVTLIVKGLELKFSKIYTFHTLLDCSCNNFQGEIPDAIGDLVSVYVLNLSHNSLTGTIPKSFGNLRELESMDLSMNRLTGEIPRALAKLTFLEFLNLSYNKLVGEIPLGQQLQTLPASSFLGNTGLCGIPLDRRCNITDGNGSSGDSGEVSAKEEEIDWMYVSVAAGFVVGLGSIVWLLFGWQRFSEEADEILERMFKKQEKRRRHGGR